MNQLKFENYPSRAKRVVILGSVLVAGLGISLSERQQAEDATISIGDISCQGNSLAQFEPNTTISEIAETIASETGIQDQLSEDQRKDLKSIVIKRIVEEDSEDSLYEIPGEDGNTSLAIKRTVTANFPTVCKINKFYF